MKYHGCLIALGMLLASCSGKEESESKAPNQPQSVDSPRMPSTAEVTMSSSAAIVESIDHQSRMVTLRGPYGTRTTYMVGDRVKNLEQIQVGDKVVVDYYESKAIQVVKPGTSVDQRETIVDSAEPGDKPAGRFVTITTMVATIEQIDYSAPTITLRDQKGNLRTVRVRHPERLKLVKVGDTLKITYAEAVIVSVSPALPTPQ